MARYDDRHEQNPVTNVTIPPGFGVTWEFVPGDKELARQAIIFLENRRVLFGARHLEDEMECVQSAVEIRNRLTDLIPAAKQGGGVENSIRAMRAACLKFVEAAGPGGRNFRGRHGGGAGPFGQALGELRSLMGVQLALLTARYDLEIEEELASIFPPADRDDLSWLPGFESQ
jgi:Family of unknown function (DUF6650)